jgi:hypothetical protein
VSDSQALLAEAAAKTGLVWLRPTDQARSWPAWHRWHEASLWVISGPGEQELPALLGDVDVIVGSKSTGARLLTVRCQAATLDPAEPQWLAMAAVLAPHRLNSRLSPIELPQHWRSAGVTITSLVPGAVGERPGHYAQDSGAAPARPSAATTSGWRPWHWRGRSRGR